MCDNRDILTERNNNFSFGDLFVIINLILKKCTRRLLEIPQWVNHKIPLNQSTSLIVLLKSQNIFVYVM